ncbi:MAG: response regulator [Verrucomicrobiota bacterium]|nr:response regulator [Verrucomicrobiota bacterium]
MKKVLIVEDDPVVANIYKNKLLGEGYEVQSASEGETGLRLIGSFQPDVVLLDLLLPRMSGVDVIRQIRAGRKFARLPIIVFSNVYITNLIQEAAKAGATQCLAKANCTPQRVLDLVRQAVGDSGIRSQGHPVSPPAPSSANATADAEFRDGLRKIFVDNLPGTLAALRANLQSLIKSDGEKACCEQIHALYRRVHALTGNAGLAGLAPIARMGASLEALLKELSENPKRVNHSTLRTVAAAIDFLGQWFEKGAPLEQQEFPAVSILVVDDEAISRRAVAYALDKARLQSVVVEDPKVALDLLREKDFDLAILDVDMPGVTGLELCMRLRAMPRHKTTPVIFVTALSDFDDPSGAVLAGGNDFIAKPFPFAELSVKALIHVLRGKLRPVD